MRALICAGAPLADELKHRFERRFGKALQNYYALSECTPVFGAYAGDHDLLPSGRLGRLAPMAQVKIVDETGKECSQGTPGELLVRGASLMSRYHGDPENTRRVFVDGWFRTGDLACESPPGYFAIVGRKKDIIIRGGANISPFEVESTLMRHPAVKSVAVIGLPNRTFGEVPAAVVVLRAGAQATPAELSAFAARKLAEFKIPAHFAFLTEMPLGQTGKIDRNALKARCMELFA
jgi:long-chain acyl-CoA synthetase